MWANVLFHWQQALLLIYTTFGRPSVQYNESWHSRMPALKIIYSWWVLPIAPLPHNKTIGMFWLSMAMTLPTHYFEPRGRLRWEISVINNFEFRKSLDFELSVCKPITSFQIPIIMPIPLPDMKSSIAIFFGLFSFRIIGNVWAWIKEYLSGTNIVDSNNYAVLFSQHAMPIDIFFSDFFFQISSDSIFSLRIMKIFEIGFQI